MIWLAPLAVRNRRRHAEIGFLTVLAAIGALAAFRLPPVDNLLRALPVLGVTDNRRLTLWVAFGLCLLGGFGLDALAQGERLPRWWIAPWLVGALIMAAVAVSAPRLEPMLRQRATRHYRAAAEVASGVSPAVLDARAERQVREALSFIPRYYGLAAAELLLLALLAATGRFSPRSSWLAGSVLVVTVAELACFGIGLNPAIARDVQEWEPPVIARLRAGLKPGQRRWELARSFRPTS